MFNPMVELGSARGPRQCDILRSRQPGRGHPLAERRGGAKAAGVAAARTQDV